MGRKNDRVRRSNARGRLDRGSDIPRIKVPQQPRIQVQDLILPDGKCGLMNPRRPKARFATESKAAAALKQAQQQRARVGSTHVEKRYYECPEGGCGGWHLSSREEFDDSIRVSRLEQRRERS
jgi:hypothetical protein